MIQVLTHRGLDPARTSFFPESTYEAFEDQLLRGLQVVFKRSCRIDRLADRQQVHAVSDENAFVEQALARRRHRDDDIVLA